MSESEPQTVPISRDLIKLQFRVLPLLLAVVGVVLAGGGYFAWRENRARQVANQQARSFLEVTSEIEAFHEATGRYPTNREGLDVLVEAVEGTSDGLLPVWLMDEWGRPISYAVVSGDAEMPFELHSCGANGVDDGGFFDDISWRKGFQTSVYSQHTAALWIVAGVLYTVVVLLFAMTWLQARRVPVSE